MFATWSLVALGQSFAIFPAIRQLRTRGPYACIRHPVYAGELVMIIAAAATRLDGWSLLLAVIGLATTGARVFVEEGVLSAEDEYVAYRGKVRWRLVPGVW